MNIKLEKRHIVYATMLIGLLLLAVVGYNQAQQIKELERRQDIDASLWDLQIGINDRVHEFEETMLDMWELQQKINDGLIGYR